MINLPGIFTYINLPGIFTYIGEAILSFDLINWLIDILNRWVHECDYIS